MNYQAKLLTPFGVLGIRCTDEVLTAIDFLPASEKPQPAFPLCSLSHRGRDQGRGLEAGAASHANALAAEACEQLLRYLEDPDAQFSIPLEPGGTDHQQKVWQAMLAIPRGKTRSYGEVAAELKSCAQAVGQACGANPIPIIIPCHRIVGKAGLGGFARHTSGEHLDIKRWLLVHEQR